MDFRPDEPIKLTRDCQVVAVPAGHTVTLPQGTEVMITQSLGGSYTIMVPSYGGLFRLSDRDADAIGRESRPAEGEIGAQSAEPLSGEALEGRVWQTLKTCYDPEIPVNIVDLGLIYDMHIDQLADGARLVIPVGPQGHQILTVVTRHGDHVNETAGEGCVFVPLVGNGGWTEEQT